MKFCTKCGHKILRKSYFCSHCGNDLREKLNNNFANQTINNPTNKIINYSINKTIKGSTDDCINDTINEYINRSISNPTNAAIVESTDDSISETINESTDESINTPAIETTNKFTDEFINETINESTDNSTIDTTNKSTDDSIIAPATPDKVHNPTLKSSKMLKTSLLLCTLFIILVVAIITINNSLTDPTKLVTRFEKDVSTNNTSDLAHIIYTNNDKLTVNNQSLLPLLSSFKSNPSYYNKVIDNLKNDAISPKNINNLNIKSGNILTLVNKGNFMFFHNYKIIVKPCFVNIKTTVKNVTFSINGTQIGKSDTDNSSKKFGPYIAGNYTIIAKFKGKYISQNKSYLVSLVSNNKGITKLNVLDDMKYIHISSDYYNAKIFVNGKDTNVKVNDATNFGPIDSSSKISASYIEYGTTLKSREYSLSNEDTDLYLAFQNYTAYGNTVKY
ncbi:zinc ribbon domain-containing protein [Clostridium psychrophilum]|uniref:zinc ribbon domain-containing protein n=1 Tax=Clostridium psychrophilum TaxID=132926 RepID=UPI001C0B1484|nr:zinc ribbon domain-containing protein [Clostridium psychrophilum]MBU3179950.1 hypothetical protein [Clostridium psychrophilum]